MSGGALLLQLTPIHSEGLFDHEGVEMSFLEDAEEITERKYECRIFHMDNGWRRIILSDAGHEGIIVMFTKDGVVKANFSAFDSYEIEDVLRVSRFMELASKVLLLHQSPDEDIVSIVETWPYR